MISPSALEGSALLEAQGLTLTFGGVKALDRVDLTIWGRGIVGLIGPNGAGKTSLFNVLTGAYRAGGGRATFDDIDLLGRRQDQIARLGLARTFQNYSLNSASTVLQNVMLGAHLEIRPSLFGGLVGSPLARRRERQALDRAWDLMDLFGLADVANHPAGSLSFGSAKRVDLVRALMTKPRLLLLDEPASGLTEEEIGQLSRWLLQVAREQHLPMVLVEHNMGFVMSTAARLVVMNFGRVIADGKPKKVSALPEVTEAYFGGALT